MTTCHGFPRSSKGSASSSARWNGNIAEWEWRHGAETPLMYGLTYDGVNRLMQTAQEQKSGASWADLAAGYLEKGITYDLNGNILTLQRTAAGALIDNLAYNYTGNQLTGLTEAVRTAPTNDIYAPGGAVGGHIPMMRTGI